MYHMIKITRNPFTNKEFIMYPEQKSVRLAAMIRWTNNFINLDLLDDDPLSDAKHQLMYLRDAAKKMIKIFVTLTSEEAKVINDLLSLIHYRQAWLENWIAKYLVH